MHIADALVKYLSDPDGGPVGHALEVNRLRVLTNIQRRVHRKKRPPKGGTTPCVVIHLVSSVGDRSHSGPSQWAETRLQLDVHGITVDQVRATAELVRLALDGFQGEMGGKGGLGVEVDGAHVEDIDDGPGWDDQLEQHVWMLDVSIEHAVTVGGA